MVQIVTKEDGTLEERSDGCTFMRRLGRCKLAALQPGDSFLYRGGRYKLMSVKDGNYLVNRTDAETYAFYMAPENEVQYIADPEERGEMRTLQQIQRQEGCGFAKAKIIQEAEIRAINRLQ